MPWINEYITREEFRTLAKQLGTHGRSFTDTDATKVLEWATKARMNATLLEMALAGEITFHVVDGDLKLSLTQDGYPLELPSQPQPVG